MALRRLINIADTELTEQIFDCIACAIFAQTLHNIVDDISNGYDGFIFIFLKRILRIYCSDVKSHLGVKYSKEIAK